MPEPTKEQIQTVFKKLKQNRYNKVSWTLSLSNTQHVLTFYIHKRHALIATQRIPTGLLFHLVFTFVPIVHLHIVI